MSKRPDETGACDLVKACSSCAAPPSTSAYAQHELAYHRFVNGAVAKVFIPNAKNRELKALLKSALRTFKIHEHHAAQMARAVRG